MAKLIGGPAHGRKIQATAHKVYVPVLNNTTAPAQVRKNGSAFLQCVYQRTRITRDGEVLYVFLSGYYR
jgi:hypothetical protein